MNAIYQVRRISILTDLQAMSFFISTKLIFILCQKRFIAYRFFLFRTEISYILVAKLRLLLGNCIIL